MTLRSLTFERAAVLFNLAALYSQLASAEDRSSQDGLKRASAYYQVSFCTISDRFNRERTACSGDTGISELVCLAEAEVSPRYRRDPNRPDRTVREHLDVAYARTSTGVCMAARNSRQVSV